MRAVDPGGGASKIAVLMAKTPTRDPLGRLAPARPLVELTEILRTKSAATASGLWGSSVGAVTSVLQRALRRPVLVVCGHIDEADDLADDIELFLGRRPEVLPDQPTPDVKVRGLLGPEYGPAWKADSYLVPTEDQDRGT